MMHFITFADSAYQFQASMLKASLYLSLGANKFTFKCYTPKDLDDLNFDFNRFASSYKRGYGLWSWKIPIIFDYLKAIPDGDIVWYLDSTMLVMPEIEKVQFSSHDSLYICPNIFDEPYAWSKYVSYLPTKYKDFLRNGVVVDAAYFGIRKNSTTLNFFHEILKLPWITKYYLEDDAETFSTRFIEHRHDQSLISYFVGLNNIALSMPLTQYFLNNPVLYHSRLRRVWSRRLLKVIGLVAIYHVKSIFSIFHTNKINMRKTINLPVKLLGLSRYSNTYNIHL